MKVCIKTQNADVDKDKIEVISSFIKFLQTQLQLSDDIEVRLTNDQKETGTTGVRIPGSKMIILAKGRMLIDILRTISHEWVHEFQFQKMGLDDKKEIRDIGGPEENMSNILSGILIKKFDKQNPDFKTNLYESLLTELSPQSSGVEELISLLSKRPELLKYLGFKSLDSLKYYIEGANIDDFDELRGDIERYFNDRDKYIENELEEIERTVEDLSKIGVDTTVNDVVKAFRDGIEIQIPSKVWNKLENTDSNKIKRGEMDKVKKLAKEYNKMSPIKLSKALKSGFYDRPMILKFGDRYYLVAGNTRLSTAAASGIEPQVLIGEI